MQQQRQVAGAGAAHMAKWMSSSSMRALHRAKAIQLHGGIGMSNECIVGHCFKHLMVIDALQGNTATQLRALSAGLKEPA